MTGPLSHSTVGECLDFAILLRRRHGNRQIRDYCSQMLTRFKSLKDGKNMPSCDMIQRAGDSGPSQRVFLAELLGLTSNGGHLVKRDQIIIVDMNAVEDEVVASLGRGPGSKASIAPAGPNPGTGRLPATGGSPSIIARTPSGYAMIGGADCERGPQVSASSCSPHHKGRVNSSKTVLIGSLLSSIASRIRTFPAIRR